MTEIDLHQHDWFYIKRILDYLKERTRGQIILYEKTIKNACATVGLLTIYIKKENFLQKSMLDGDVYFSRTSSYEISNKKWTDAHTSVTRYSVIYCRWLQFFNKSTHHFWAFSL